MDYKELFNQMHPDFFEAPYIRQMPESYAFAELVLELKKEKTRKIDTVLPSNITFGFYDGDIKKLLAAVESVDEDWCQYFSEDSRIFCAFDGEKIAAFCILDEGGIFQGLRIGGPGCVGTVPEYRKQGIGLEMVRLATDILQKEDFDISWIHYTHLEKWYSKLGYHTVLKWGSRGFRM